MQNDTHSGFIFTFNHVDIHVVSVHGVPHIPVKRIVDYVDVKQWPVLLYMFKNAMVPINTQMPGDPKNISTLTMCVAINDLQPILDYLYDEHKEHDLVAEARAKILKSDLVSKIKSSWCVYRMFGGGEQKQDQDK
jgi:hypothetical protein